MSRGERIDWTLVAVDALTTTPLVVQLLSDDKWVATLPIFASATQFHGSVTDNGRKSGIATRDSVSVCARMKS